MSVQTSQTSPSAVDPADGPGEPVLPSLSPSRAADFKTCPLLYRFRAIDRIPELPTPDQIRGTLVHAVLERLFDLPAAHRTHPEAAALVAPQWQRLCEERPELVELFPPVQTPAPAPAPTGGTAAAETASASLQADHQTESASLQADHQTESRSLTDPDALIASAVDLLDGYFAVEDPRRLEPAEREFLVEAVVDDHLLLRGYIDRLDVSSEGDLRVVDYKTGGAPREAFEARALFQLKFYALVLWRTRGVVPRVLRLLYLKDAEACDYTPDVEELQRFERTLLALWQAIERATDQRDFRPRPSRLCGWCAHQVRCPAYGGALPPFPEPPPPVQAPAPEPLIAMDE